MEKVLFDSRGQAITPTKISEKIESFGNKYNNAVKTIINESISLGVNGKAFINCASLILSSFGMTRSGPFYGDTEGRLSECWDAIGKDLIKIRKVISESGLSRERYLLELNQMDLDLLIMDIWVVAKKLLPISMGKTSYGLVGASKILFSVLPEIVLPIDNAQWLHLFKTVDLGDVIHRMVWDIKNWEIETGKQLNEMDQSKRLTTLPAVYNVMAMVARH